MKPSRIVAAAWLLSLSLQVFAMDGVFDRSAEVQKYMAIVKNGTRGDMVVAAKDMYVSGINDAELAAAVNERLLKDYAGLKLGERLDTQYGAWMVKALASFGIEQYAETLKTVENGVQIPSVSSECGEELPLISWHKTKNAIMASRANHQEGDKQRASQFLNLLKSEDFAYKYVAADRMSWEKVLDARLMDEIASQLLKYMDSTGMHASRPQTKTMGMYAKLLGYSSNAKYRQTLEQVVASNANYLLKKHAKDALVKLKD